MRLCIERTAGQWSHTKAGSRAPAWGRNERRRSSSASDDGGGGHLPRSAPSELVERGNEI